jgi:molecular chaperone GrpE
MKALDEQGVKKIDADGKLFDVNYHEALMQRPDDSVEPHTILEEIEKGYIYKDKVLRHSKVIVSEDNGGSAENEEKEEEN